MNTDTKPSIITNGLGTSSPTVIKANLNIQMTELKPEEQQRAVQLAETIDILDTTKVIDFGKDSQSSTASFADSMLSETRTRDLDVIGTQLMTVLKHTKKVDLKKSPIRKFLFNIPIIGRFIDKAEDYSKQFDSVKANVDKVVQDMQITEVSLHEKIKALDVFHEKNNEAYADLVVHIAAGHMKINQIENEILPALIENNPENDPMKSQKIYDYKAALHRFSKKISDLEVMATNTLQTGPQIRVVQNNNIVLAENIRNTANNVIPLWKKQFALYTALEDQRIAAEMEKTIKDASNEIIVKNSDSLRENSILIAQQNERAVIDMATLQAVQNSLEQTLTEVSRIAQEGKRNRAQMQVQLKQLTGQVQERLKIGNY